MNPKRLELTQEELASVLQRKRRDESSNIKVSPEELFMSEIGYYFGWDAMMAVANNDITLDEANVLVAGARKVWNSHMIDLALVNFTASAAAQSGKKAKKVMMTGLKQFIKRAKADL